MMAMVFAAAVAVSAPVPTEANRFIVACTLFSGQKVEGSAETKSGREAYDLNLLVERQAEDTGFFSVVDTFDPKKVSVVGTFKKAFFEKGRFAALTGDATTSETRMLALLPRGASEYDAMLRDVGKRQPAFNGRCWMSNVANATEEFEKLKVQEASQ